MKTKKNRITFTLTELIVVSIIVGIISAGLGSLLCLNLNKEQVTIVKENNKTTTVNNSNFQLIVDTYNNILSNFYKEVDPETLINGAISGMLDAVDDPYTTFMEKTTYSNFNITLNGQFKGFGVEISSLNNKLTIVGIFNDSPAALSGMKLGDVFVSIDGKSTKDMTAQDLTQYIFSKKTDDFVVVVNRDGKEVTINITKDVVVLKSVSSKVYKENKKTIGYIYASTFASNTYQQFKEELENLKKQNIDSLIIDLRDNTGGELTTALNMISLFINSDKIAFQMESRQGTVKYTSMGTEDAKYPIVILINHNSASASEVMTAALKENLNATLVGTTTYGKGTAQELLNLSNGEQYKMTTMKWLTPNGNWINEVGIKPDIEVELSEKYQKDPKEANDNQLQAAIKYLKEH